jgi:hypothetical protein
MRPFPRQQQGSVGRRERTAAIVPSFRPLRLRAVADIVIDLRLFGKNDQNDLDGKGRRIFALAQA